MNKYGNAVSVASRRTLMAAMTMMLAVPTIAEARPSTKSYTCSGLKGFIASRGAVVMDTKNRRVYDRLIASRRFCTFDKKPERIDVPTRTGQCQVLHCIEKEFEDP